MGVWKITLNMHDVFVKADAETYQLQLEQGATVGTLRDEIEKWTYCPPDKQTLYFLACPVMDDSLKIAEIMKTGFGNEGRTFHLALPTAGDVKIQSDVSVIMFIGDEHNFVSKRLTKTHGEFINVNISNKRMALVYHDETDNKTINTTFHVQVYKEQKDPKNRARYKLKGKKSEDGTQELDMWYSEETIEVEDGKRELVNPKRLPSEKKIYTESTNKFDDLINKIMVPMMNYITNIQNEWINN